MIPTQKFILENMEEMLGAYMEGNLSKVEETEVDKLLSENPTMNELLEDACQDIIFGRDDSNDTDVISQEEIDLLQSYDFDIDELLKEQYTMDDMNANLFSDAGETTGSVGETAGSVGETTGSVGETTGSAAAIKGEKATGPMQVGEAPVDEYSAYVKQGYSDTCAINSQKIILDAFGKHYTEEQLRDQAIKHGLYREGYGTSLNDMGKLLSLNDCPCTNYIGGNVADLTKALAEGKMVMMAVDSGELWKEGFLGRLWEKLEDKIPFIGGPDHALLVTGIDASDPEHVMVVVTDPGSGDLNKPYPIEQFIDAAKDSHFFMTVTDNPKPNVFEAYQNPSMTHLPQIGDLNYHRFVENYGQYFTLGNSVGELLPNNISEELVSSVYGEEIEEQDDSTNPVNDVDENGREDDAEKVTEEENGNNVPDTHHEFKDENEDGETKGEEEELAEGEENDHKGSEEDDENDHKDSGEEGEKEEGEEGDDQEGEDDEIDEYEN